MRGDIPLSLISQFIIEFTEDTSKASGASEGNAKYTI